MIGRGEELPNNETYNFILFALITDGLISVEDDPFTIHITHFGFKEILEWDAVLGVSINNQLLEQSHGDA